MRLTEGNYFTVNLCIMRELLEINDLTDCFIGYQDAHAASPDGKQALR